MHNNEELYKCILAVSLSICLGIILSVLLNGCVVEERAVQSYYPYYYDYYVRPVPRPAYAPNPYYIPPRPVYRPKPVYHNPHPMRPNYNVRPGAAQPRLQGPSVKPSAPPQNKQPRNNIGTTTAPSSKSVRGASPYTR